MVNKMRNKSMYVTLLTASLMTGLTACSNHDGLYAPADEPKEEVKPASEYFDFEMRQGVALNFNLGTAGAGALVEVFDQYPFVAGTYSRNEQEAVFKVFVDDNGCWRGEAKLPTAAKTLYVCANAPGLPVCETVTVENGRVTYAAGQTKAAARTATRSVAVGDKQFYTIDADKRMYSLCQWGEHGNVTAPADYFTDAGLSATWVSKVQSAFWNGGSSRPFYKDMDNSKFVTSVEHVNTTVAKSFRNEQGTMTTVEDAEIYFTFMEESAWNQNAIGYYYYPSDQVPSSPEQVKRIVMLPNASTAGNVPFLMQDWENEKYCAPAANTSEQWLYKKIDAPVRLGNKVKLLFEREDGTVTDRFPAGYTIGYFLISNGYGNGYGRDHTPNDINLTKGYMGNLGYIYSNQAWNEGGRSSFVALTDKETGRVVYGIEDGTDKSYEDILFYIDTDLKGAIDDPERPEIPEDGDKLSVEKFSGTLLYEDIWPTGGDYDMNDVIVEYTRAVTFDKNNNVVEINDTFTPVWDGANYHNAFAYQIDKGQTGEVVLPEGGKFEDATNSVIVFANAKTVQNKSFTVKRTFGGSFSKSSVKDYNPYIIVNYEEGQTSRVEVHLPKQMPTSMADASLNYSKDDAYYIRKDGKFPFAMDIPVHGFKPVTERSTIGSEGEYPGFTKWANGESGYDDWYLNK